MLDNIQSRISKVKASLVIEQPYFGSISSTLKPVLNEDIKTFLSTAKNFEYNDDYINSLSNEELGFILTNSAMHQVFLHEARIDSRMEWLWVLATDYAINCLLVNNGLELPAHVNYDERFDDMSAEAIYASLENEIDDDKHSPEQVSQIKFEEHQEQEIDNDESIQDMHEQLLNKAKLQGDLPLGIEILVPNIFEGKISWEDELYNVIDQSIRFDYRLLPPNKRYISQGIALPALSGSRAKIVIAIDSSGSVDGSLLAKFLAEVESIMNTYENFEIDLLVADAKVHEHHILYPGDELSYTLKGGGGTNFENTFEYINENIDEVNLLLYFTDGFGKFPEDEAFFETVWVLSDEIEVPFGRTIFL
ncbi:vWA domain-containing protein [Poseidonibacter lekithochrous]|uniref:vWA domain-containing protein n=1 Tax=Poseidonibacter lekithochrous TaxID=1904463 RepID=UPI000D3A1C10|nr:VWA-like domain-containing protein [Poseidonibacter lekithochrous]